MPANLEVAGIVKTFGGIVAVDGASFAIAEPGICGLIGPNGAGKTTLFDIICGRQLADRGEVIAFGERIDRLDAHRRTRLGLARTFQECRVLVEETCLDNILFAAQDKRLGREILKALSRDASSRRRAREEARHLLRLVDLDRYADHLAGALSYGQRRLLEIASALIARPRMLLLDEPASGINPALLERLHDALGRIFAERRLVLLIVEHNMEFIMSLASRIIVMHQGRVLADGTPAQIQASPDVIEAYLG